MANLWDRQPREAAPAYKAFLAFRDLGPKRTIIQAYRGCQEGAKKVSRVPGSWQDWVRDHDWHRRVKAWDDRLAKVVETVVIKEAISSEKKRARKNAALEALLWKPIKYAILLSQKIDNAIASTGEPPDLATLVAFINLVDSTKESAKRAGLGGTGPDPASGPPRLIIPQTDDRHGPDTPPSEPPA